MKHIILAITAIFSSLCSFAQRVNERGLKCVSEIEYNNYGTPQVYKFGYTDDLKLRSIEFYTNGELFHSFSLDNGVLTRKDSNSNSDWVYDFDVYGNIVRITETQRYNGGTLLKIEHTYNYAKSDRNPWRNVVEDSQIEMVKCYGAKVFRKNNNDNVRRFAYPNGIICEDDDIDYYETLVNSFNLKVKNDTNIDFWQFWRSRTTDTTIVALTEWLCLRPDYLMGDWASTFEYEYDNVGNLIRIINKNKGSDYVIKEVKIKYLY